jgi:uncharacterized OB-fold protein
MNTPTRPAIRMTGLSQPFWNGVAQQRLLLQYDPVARRYQFYPRPVSLYGAAALEWREASGFGELIAFTECHAPAKGFEGLGPYLVGVVRLDEGVKFFTRIVNATFDTIAIGQRMRINWDPEAVDQLCRFEPALD